jgi:hypothetical protein
VETSFLLFLLPIELFIALEIKPRPENGTWAQAFDFLGALAGAVFIYKAWQSDFNKNWTEIVLWATSLILVPVLCWTSGMTYYSTHYSSLYALLAILVLANQNMKWHWLPVLMMGVPLLFGYQMWGSYLHKGPADIEHRNTMIDWGAYFGIFTTEREYAYLREMQDDVDAVATNAHTILFYESWPAGYMMSDLFPATRAWLIHPLSLTSRVRPFLRDYYIDPANRPDVVFRFNQHQTAEGSYDATPTKYLPTKDVFWYYLPDETGDYREVIHRPYYSVYKKKTLL